MKRDRYIETCCSVMSMKKWEEKNGWKMMWRKRKDKLWNNLVMIPTELKPCRLFFEIASFPSLSESILSRIVARQDHVRMRNLATLAIQATTPCCFTSCMRKSDGCDTTWNPYVNERTLKTVQKCFFQSKLKPPQFPCSSCLLLDFENHNFSFRNGWTINMY
jgi:hypothetical protein